MALVALKKQKLTSSSKVTIDSRPAVLKLALTHFSDEIRVQAFDTLIARYGCGHLRYQLFLSIVDLFNLFENHLIRSFARFRQSLCKSKNSSKVNKNCPTDHSYFPTAAAVESFSLRLTWRTYWKPWKSTCPSATLQSGKSLFTLSKRCYREPMRPWKTQTGVALNSIFHEKKQAKQFLQPYHPLEG